MVMLGWRHCRVWLVMEFIHHEEDDSLQPKQFKLYTMKILT